MNPNHPATLPVYYPYTITKKQVVTNRWLDLNPNRCCSTPSDAIHHQSPSVHYENTKSQDNSPSSPSQYQNQSRRRTREEESHHHQHPMADDCTCCAERQREHKRPRRVVVTKTEIDKSITFTSPTTYSTTTTVSTTTLTATLIPVLRPLQQPLPAQQQWRFQPDYPPERRENR